MDTKFIFLCAVAFVCHVNVQAQDLVVNADGDSLNVKFIKLEDGMITFIQKIEGEEEEVELPMEDVVYRPNFYAAKTTKPEAQPTSQTKSYGYVSKYVPTYASSSYKPAQRFRVGVRGGYSITIGASPETGSQELNEFYDKHRSGYHLGIDASYLIGRQSGVGVKYMRYQSDFSQTFYGLSLLGFTLPGNTTFQQQYIVNYFGPSYVANIHSEKVDVMFEAGLGYVGYEDNGTINGGVVKGKITGENLGVTLGMDVDFFITKHLSIGLGISYLGASLTTIQETITDVYGNTTTQFIHFPTMNGLQSIASIFR